MTTPLHPTNKSTPHQLRVATNHPLPRAGFAACEGPASPLPPAHQSQRAIPAFEHDATHRGGGDLCPPEPKRPQQDARREGERGSSTSKGGGDCQRPRMGKMSIRQCHRAITCAGQQKTICREGVVPFVPSIRTQQTIQKRARGMGMPLPRVATQAATNNSCHQRQRKQQQLQRIQRSGAPREAQKTPTQFAKIREATECNSTRKR